jgi:hypothetical protein
MGEDHSIEERGGGGGGGGERRDEMRGEDDERASDADQRNEIGGPDVHGHRVGAGTETQQIRCECYVRGKWTSEELPAGGRGRAALGSQFPPRVVLVQGGFRYPSSHSQ